MSLGNLLFAANTLVVMLPLMLLGYLEAQQTKRSPEWKEQRVAKWAKKDLPPLPRQVDWERFEQDVRHWLISNGDPFCPLDIDHALEYPFYVGWRQPGRKKWRSHAC